MSKHPIRCAKLLQGCGATCVEIGRQELTLRNPKSGNHHHRSRRLFFYLCPECGIEWVQDTLTHEVHPVSDGYLENLQVAYGLNAEPRPSAGQLKAVPGTPHTSRRPFSGRKRVPTHSLLIQSSRLDKPKTVPRINSLSGYKAAIEKVADLAEMEIPEDSHLYLDLLATLVGIFEYELRFNDLDRSIIPSRRKGSIADREITGR